MIGSNAYRWLVLNVTLWAILIVSTVMGWVLPFFALDPTFFSHFVFGVFVLFNLWSGWVALRMDSQMTPTQFRADKLKGDKKFVYGILSRFLNPIRIGRTILTYLGVVGTCAGIVIAFAGLTPAVVVNIGAPELLEIMRSGLGLAFMKSLVAMLGALWLYLNQAMLGNQIERFFIALFRN